MHKYLRSIGFSNIKKEELKKIIHIVENNPDYVEMAMDSEGNEFSELRIEVTKRTGIALRGNYDSKDEFHLDYYFPYYEAVQDTCHSTVQIMKESDRECFQGVCEDNNIGLDIIFHIQNMIPFLQSKKTDQDIVNPSSTSLCGLSIEGKIILPVYTDELIRTKTIKSKNTRNKLIAEARDGDANAYEKLTLDDMDKYSMISKRIKSEDVLSIVSSTFMPSGIENDKYAVIGEIMHFTKQTNTMSKEAIYILTLDCSGLCFDVCINEKDLLGQVAVGRRFKGTVWMQGKLNM